MTAPGTTLLTWTPSLMPCSANAFASAMMAALMVATAAKAGLRIESRASRDQYDRAFRGLQSIPGAYRQPPRTVQLKRHAVFPLRVRHLEQIDLRHGAGNVHQSIDSAKAVERALDEGLGRAEARANRAHKSAVRRRRLLLPPQSSQVRRSCLAARTTAWKSRARRIAVARPIPWLAPVTTATDSACMVSPYRPR